MLVKLRKPAYLVNKPTRPGSPGRGDGRPCVEPIGWLPALSADKLSNRRGLDDARIASSRESLPCVKSSRSDWSRLCMPSLAPVWMALGNW